LLVSGRWQSSKPHTVHTEVNMGRSSKRSFDIEVGGTYTRIQLLALTQNVQISGPRYLVPLNWLQSQYSLSWASQMKAMKISSKWQLTC